MRRAEALSGFWRSIDLDGASTYSRDYGWFPGRRFSAREAKGNATAGIQTGTANRSRPRDCRAARVFRPAGTPVTDGGSQGADGPKQGSAGKATGGLRDQPGPDASIIYESSSLSRRIHLREGKEDPPVRLSHHDPRARRPANRAGHQAHTCQRGGSPCCQHGGCRGDTEKDRDLRIPWMRTSCEPVRRRRLRRERSASA